MLPTLMRQRRVASVFCNPRSAVARVTRAAPLDGVPTRVTAGRHRTRRRTEGVRQRRASPPYAARRRRRPPRQATGPTTVEATAAAVTAVAVVLAVVAAALAIRGRPASRRRHRRRLRRRRHHGLAARLARRRHPHRCGVVRRQRQRRGRRHRRARRARRVMRRARRVWPVAAPRASPTWTPAAGRVVGGVAARQIGHPALAEAAAAAVGAPRQTIRLRGAPALARPPAPHLLPPPSGRRQPTATGGLRRRRHQRRHLGGPHPCLGRRQWRRRPHPARALHRPPHRGRLRRTAGGPAPKHRQGMTVPVADPPAAAVATAHRGIPSVAAAVAVVGVAPPRQSAPAPAPHWTTRTAAVAAVAAAHR